MLLYVNKGMIAKARKNNEGYIASPIEQSLRGEAQVEDENLPSFLVAVIPLILVVVLCMIFQLGIGLDSSPSALFAQIISSVVCLLLNSKRGVMKKLPQAISNGCMQTSMPMLATCAIVGYATLISFTTFYSGVMGSVGNLNLSPYLLVVLGTMICSALGADPLSGISMSMSTFGQTAIASGASAALVHRLTVAASTTFDSMPYSGNLNCTLGFLGLSFKDVYKNIVVVQIGANCAATAVGLVIEMIIG
ncbi:MAG: hypothetical protein LUH07_07775 [Lachnospiraceae bacterium]|nr:hypothetical protein [Lachnospiraceae bacterium]